MKRRTLLMAAGVVPVAALAPLPAVPASVSEPTEIRSLYVDWLALTKAYFAVDAKYDRKEIDATRFEELADPILDRRMEIEDRVAVLDSQTSEDLAIKAIMAAHYAWGDAEMQDSLITDANRFLKTAG